MTRIASGLIELNEQTTLSVICPEQARDKCRGRIRLSATKAIFKNKIILVRL
jgi:hypothetical protein